MKNPFKKEIASYQTSKPITPYQSASQEWDLRIGTTQMQIRNWRFVAILSLFAAVFSLLSLVFISSKRTDRLYVAEVTKEGRVVNVAPILVAYQPTQAQKEYFICRFIELVENLTLDPVVVKQNWLTAYKFLSSSGKERLNAYFKKNNPVDLLGKKTVIVEIIDVNQVSKSTIHVDWVEHVVNTNGQDEGNNNYSGIFTILVKQPKTRQEILQNPLGIYIVDFSVTTKTSEKYSSKEEEHEKSTE